MTKITVDDLKFTPELEIVLNDLMVQTDDDLEFQVSGAYLKAISKALPTAAGYQIPLTTHLLLTMVDSGADLSNSAHLTLISILHGHLTQLLTFMQTPSPGQPPKSDLKAGKLTVTGDADLVGASVETIQTPVDPDPKVWTPPAYPVFQGNGKTAPQTALETASQLLYPVKGTSTGSRYFVVFLSPAVACAVRILEQDDDEGYSVSIRLEKYGQQLANLMTQAGMFGNGGDGGMSDKYMSMHVQCANFVDIYKILGAVHAVCSMVSLCTPLPPVAIMETLVA